MFLSEEMTQFIILNLTPSFALYAPALHRATTPTPIIVRLLRSEGVNYKIRKFGKSQGCIPLKQGNNHKGLSKWTQCMWSGQYSIDSSQMHSLWLPGFDHGLMLVGQWCWAGINFCKVMGHHPPWEGAQVSWRYSMPIQFRVLTPLLELRLGGFGFIFQPIKEMLLGLSFLHI
jgi:hypothetical protein